MKALGQYHPGVGFSFFLLMIVISLASMHPVFQCINIVTAIAYGIFLSGFTSFVKGNWWVVLIIVFVSLFNGLFVGGSGLTVLFTFDIWFIKTSVSVESLFYGAVMGTMLANVMLWFNLLGKVSSMQGFIELFTKVSPTAGMMVARITVFIPELLAQARLTDRAQNIFKPDVATEPRPEGGMEELTEQKGKKARRGQLAYAAMLSSHLMEWGMEKSIITANSMMARGYGSRKRTSYRRTRFTLRDKVPLVIIIGLGLTSLVCTIWAGGLYGFYPYLSPISFWWGYIPLVLLCLVPMCLQIGEELAWWRSK